MEEISIGEEARNWLELPRDVMSQIFLKLNIVEILHSVQKVCTLWRIISKDPLLYRSIDLRNQWDVFDGDDDDMERIAKEGVERSSGQLVKFSMEHFGTQELLHFMANRLLASGDVQRKVLEGYNNHLVVLPGQHKGQQCGIWILKGQCRERWPVMSFRDDDEEEEVEIDGLKKRKCLGSYQFLIGYARTVVGNNERSGNPDVGYWSSNLRFLRLAYCYHISDEALMAVTKQLPLLEEVELCHCSFSTAALETFGRFCPHLKSFRVDHQGVRSPLLDCDEEAFAIAKNMPQLCHLHLFGNKMTDNGLRAILDGCPHLESLDLRQCFSVYMGGDLEKNCKDRIKKLKLPNDPTDDYEFVAELDDFGSFDADYPSGVSEIDFISEDEYVEFSEGSYFSDMDEFYF
ncbi:hypothetical protein Syun_028214 [Stephania yunnanensis]|uniref:F-box domain-containing protein n=1 Tax=Stephania yunnanensis TaxID=152371 RepID=A0AAP0EMJ0_9MAGN